MWCLWRCTLQHLFSFQLNALRHMYYTDFMNNTQELVNNHRTIQPPNDRTVLAYFASTTASPIMSATALPIMSTTAPPIMSTTNGIGTVTPTGTVTTTYTVTTTGTVTTTDSAYGVSENSFLFLASLCLVLLSFLEI